jgi:hypothetical protein
VVKRSGYRRAMAMEPWAKAQVERLIAPLGKRWVHVQAVARQARPARGPESTPVEMRDGAFGPLSDANPR